MLYLWQFQRSWSNSRIATRNLSSESSLILLHQAYLVAVGIFAQKCSMNTWPEGGGYTCMTIGRPSLVAFHQTLPATPLFQPRTFHPQTKLAVRIGLGSADTLVRSRYHSNCTLSVRLLCCIFLRQSRLLAVDRTCRHRHPSLK